MLGKERALETSAPALQVSGSVCVGIRYSVAVGSQVLGWRRQSVSIKVAANSGIHGIRTAGQLVVSGLASHCLGMVSHDGICALPCA